MLLENLLYGTASIIAILTVVVALPSNNRNDYSWISIIIAFVAIAIGAFFLLSGCSAKKPKDNQIDYQTEAKIKFDQAMRDVYKGSCLTAYDKFEKVSEIYPYSDLAKKSSVMQIYCDFIQKNYESAASLADLHEKFYPYDEYGDYVAYIKSISLIKIIKGFKRDIKLIEDAEIAINFLINSYPASPYKVLLSKPIVDVQKLKYKNEFEIVNFYIKTNRKIAAFKRLISIKQNYEHFSFYEEAKINNLYEQNLADISDFTASKKKM